MDTTDRLAARLVADHGARPLSDLGVDAAATERFDFVAAKDHWGSVGLVALVRADGLDEVTIAQHAAGLHELTTSLHQHAGVVTFYVAGGSASVKLGSFATLCFVFEDGCPEPTSEHIRRQRLGSASKKQRTLAWSVDVPAGRVRDHGLLPRGVFPSRRWVQEVVRSRP